MIIGTVSSNREPTIMLEIRGYEGAHHPSEAIIDTGYTGYLTLPTMLIHSLELPWRQRGRALLANGEESIFDIHKGEMFGPLQDVTLFNQVSIDPEVHTLVWPNGADFDPATLHDWPDYSDQLRDMAQQWALSVPTR